MGEPVEMEILVDQVEPMEVVHLTGITVQMVLRDLAEVPVTGRMYLSMVPLLSLVRGEMVDVVQVRGMVDAEEKKWVVVRMEVKEEMG